MEQLIGMGAMAEFKDKVLQILRHTKSVGARRWNSKIMYWKFTAVPLRGIIEFLRRAPTEK
jgi:hypothetical protein